MRSLALTALLASVVAFSLAGQSLTEHAAAAAGATIGTAAGKPLGTALGKIFGDVDKSTSKAATPTSKTAKPAVTKPTPVAPQESTASAPVATPIGVGGDSAAVGGGGGGSSHHSARRREVTVEPEPVVQAPIVPVVEPVVKEPTVAEVAGIKIGATASELRAALGAPESTVSIPDDDGHLRETCQYWAKGEPIGTIRLDNGRVVSVQTAN